MSEAQNPQNLNQSLKKGLLMTLLVLGSIGMGLVALWNIELGDESLSSLWARSDKPLFIAALGLISCAMPCVAMRWRALLPRENQSAASPLFMTAILSSAFVLNLALPGPVGEAISAGMLSQRSKTPFSDSLAALAVSRIIGLASSCMLAGLMWAFAPFPTPPEWASILSATAVVLLLVAGGTAAVTLFPATPIRILNAFKPAKPKNGLSRLWLKTIDAILSLFEAVQATATRGARAYAHSLFWALSGHALVACGIAMAAQAGGTAAPWSAVIFTYAASIAGSVVMFMFPGSAVGWDVLFGTTLAMTANISAIEAGAVTIVVRVQQLLVAIFGAGALWWYGATVLQKDTPDD